jgi:hypothetical protein
VRAESLPTRAQSLLWLLVASYARILSEEFNAGPRFAVILHNQRVARPPLDGNIADVRVRTSCAHPSVASRFCALSTDLKRIPAALRGDYLHFVCATDRPTDLDGGLAVAKALTVFLAIDERFRLRQFLPRLGNHRVVPDSSIPGISYDDTYCRCASALRAIGNLELAHSATRLSILWISFITNLGMPQTSFLIQKRPVCAGRQGENKRHEKRGDKPAGRASDHGKNLTGDGNRDKVTKVTGCLGQTPYPSSDCSALSPSEVS